MEKHHPKCPLAKQLSLFLLLISFPLFAQEITVFGQVTTIAAGMIQPLSGAHVSVSDIPEMGAYSDEDGNYTFTFLWLWDGPVVATCEAEGYQTVNETFWPDGAEYQLNFQLNPALPQESALFGHVYEDSFPYDILMILSGAHVQIFGGFTGGLLADTYTDSSGYYEFGDVAYAAYQITVEKEGYIGQEAPLPGYSNEPVEIDFYLLPDSGTEVGWIYGMVSEQFSPEGPTFPIAGAQISAVPAEGPEPNPMTESDENGQYVLELPAFDIPWIVTCITDQGNQQTELLILPGVEQELNFNFNAWEYPQLSAPRNLSAELDPSLQTVFLNWEVPFHVPDNCAVQYGIYVHSPNAPDNQWELIDQTEALNWEHQPDLPGNEPWEICYRVTALCGDDESEPSNVACVWNPGFFPPAPVDLTAWYDPSNGLGGTAFLDWNYPPLPDPDFLPLFNIYANLGWQSNYEYSFIDQTPEQHYEYLFNDFPGPDSIACFKVSAVVNGMESDFSNQACVYPWESQDNGILFGTVFQVSQDMIDVIPGAVITAVQQLSGAAYDAVSGEDGGYEMEVMPGPYLLTCQLPDGQSLEQDAMVPPNSEVQVDFYFGYQAIEPVLSGMVYGYTAFGDTMPLWNAHIILSNENDMYETYTEEGNYWIGLPQPGIYSVEVEADGYVGLWDELSIEGYTEHDFYLDPLDNMFPAILAAGSGTALPGDTVAIPIYLENMEPVAGIQFTMLDDPDLLTTVDYSSALDCFSTSFNEVDGAVITVFFSTEGCALEPGEYTFATLYYRVSEVAELGSTIGLGQGDVIVSDPQGNSIPAEAGGSTVIVGMPGDVNQDGNRDILDIVLLVNFVIQADNPTDYQFWAGDLNGDNDLNILDVVRLVNLILDLG